MRSGASHRWVQLQLQYSGRMHDSTDRLLRCLPGMYMLQGIHGNTAHRLHCRQSNLASLLRPETTHRGPTTAQPATGGEHCFDYATLMCMEMLRRHKPPRQALNSCYPNRLSNSPCPRALLSWRPTAWAPEAAMPVPKDHSSAAVATEQSNTRIHSPTMRTQSTLWCGTIQWRHALLVKRPSLHASHMGARPALAQHLRCTCEAAASAAPCTQRNCRYACPAARLLPWAADCAHAQLLRGPPAI
jgi:hypothetical protein